MYIHTNTHVHSHTRPACFDTSPELSTMSATYYTNLASFGSECAATCDQLVEYSGKCGWIYKESGQTCGGAGGSCIYIWMYVLIHVY